MESAQAASVSVSTRDTASSMVTGDRLPPEVMERRSSFTARLAAAATSLLGYASSNGPSRFSPRRLSMDGRPRRRLFFRIVSSLLTFFIFLAQSRDRPGRAAGTVEPARPPVQSAGAAGANISVAEQPAEDEMTYAESGPIDECHAAGPVYEGPGPEHLRPVVAGSLVAPPPSPGVDPAAEATQGLFRFGPRKQGDGEPGDGRERNDDQQLEMNWQ